MGVRDSKLLAPARREAICDALAAVGLRVTVVIPPKVVDRYVEHRALNRLEAEAFAWLVRSTAPGETFVDACDPVAARFGALVARLSGHPGPVRARHGADRAIPVVGGASIVAKVARDRAIARLAEASRAEFGSGYPSDPRTLGFLRGILGDRRPVPPWVRSSWSTVARVKRELSDPPIESFR